MSVETAGAVRPAPPRPASTPLPWLLPIRPLQAALWEIAGIAALLAWMVGSVSQPVRIGVSVAAGLVVLLTSVRFAGRHLAGWALTWTAYRLRRHDTRRDSPDPLLRVAGPVKVRQHVDRAGNRFGVAEVDGGWSALVRLTQGPGSARAAGGRPACGLCAHGRAVGVGAAADVGDPARRPGAAGALAGGAVPPGPRPDRGGGSRRRRPRCVAQHGVGGAEPDGRAGRGGVPEHCAGGGRAGEGASGGAGRPRGGSGPPDRWKSWVWGDGSQRCFRPRSSRVVDFSVPGAAFTATSYTLTRTAGGREKAEVTIRVGARPGAPVPSPGIPVVPLHGRHGAAVRQTLPLALDS